MATQFATSSASAAAKAPAARTKVCLPDVFTARDVIRVLELRSVRGLGGGPDKTILQGAVMASAHTPVTVCYVRDARDESFRIDRRAAGLGVDYVELLERHSFDAGIWPRLRQVVRDRRIDVVHAHDYKTDLLAWLLARTEGVVPVATAHGWSGTSTKERLYYAADRRLLTRYPLVIAVSSAIRDRLVASGADPRRVRHIRNGVDARTFVGDPAARRRGRAELGVTDDTMILGAVGRLSAEKRFDLLLSAAAGLPASWRWRVAVAGDGECRRALISQAEALGLSDRVTLVGHVDDVRSFHQALDVYVQTSDSEGVPNAVLEAMAVGTPVVATDVGGTSELIGHNVHGLLVPRGDVRAIANGIVATIADRTATNARVAAARARVEGELSFERRVRLVEQVYDDLMTARRSRR